MSIVVYDRSQSSTVVAVKTATKTDIQSTAAAQTWTEISSFSITYTPTRSTNKIRLQAMVNVGFNSAINATLLRFTRDGVAIGIPTTVGSRTSCGGMAYDANDDVAQTITLDYTDEPADAVQHVWKVEMFANQVGGTSHINRGHDNADAAYIPRLISTLTLTEFIP